MRIDNLIFRSSTIVLLVVCLCAFGCSPYVNVTGMVTYSDNGEPVRSGTVFFSSDTELGRATIRNGRYSVGRIHDGDGIPPGTYTISADSVPTVAPRPEIRVNPDGTFVRVENPRAEEHTEFFYTKEPQAIEIGRSMTFDFTVERGVRPPSPR